ncbi:serine/threonine-protein kinase [Sandaracinus amylolyticus]|uniref:Adenylate cyclase n=1 Tax=Sandaracinus amylolyticus TaxID=927083 RepID=A0A0F6SH27_9BACT|nr:serine/threonine-protein kinase [Sandaracinus amylolyticus]AKF09714.1 Adenylate cyclase [Sandaracinus amylolyticus]
MPILTPEERVGSLLAGRYRLESILGSGGTSVVFRASHTWTGRPVALKLLKPEHARDKGLVMRFLREARTASTIVHPNVVTILDMGTDPGGDVYLAMELLEGSSLGEILDRESTLSPERTVELLRPIMEALAIAHERGIVHRDIKPDNVLIGDRGDGVVRPILLDFGMAKMTEAAWGHATQSGLIVGTPFYMSPEQAEGASDVGAASDAWSMGVLLYRCLTGVLPFFASSPTSLLLAIVRGDHVTVSERAPHVPAALASVVERALRVDRAERYADMREMLAAIDRAARGEVEPMRASGTLPTPTAPLRSVPERASEVVSDARPGDRRRTSAIVALLAALVLAAIGVGVVGLGGEPVVASPTPAATPADVVPSAAQPVAPDETAREPIATTGATLVEPASAPPSADGMREEARARAALPSAPVEIGAAPIEPAPSPRRRRGLARSFDDREREEGAARSGSGLATEW